MDDDRVKPDREWRTLKPEHQPAIPPHPHPDEPDFQRPSTGRREDDAEDFPEERPAVPEHPDPGGERG